MPGMDFVSVWRLREHPGNVRDELTDIGELADSIAVHGILQPLVVQPDPQGHGKFVILAGHRRFAAAKKAGLDEVPVVIRQGAGGAKAIEVMLVENCQRRDLGPMEKAEAMGKLRAHGYTNVAIAKAIGLTDATVGYYLALLELDAGGRERVRAGELSAADAVGAVRMVRARRRKRAGAPAMGGPAWEPDHFHSSHPLARRARALCEAREHSMRRRIGKTACGQCWETVIRRDEQTATAALRAVDAGST